MKNLNPPQDALPASTSAGCSPSNAQGRCFSSFTPHRGSLGLNPSEQDLGAVCGDLSEAFLLLPVPGKSLGHQPCSVTTLPRAGAALAKPALVGFTSKDGAEKIFFFIFPSP